MAEYNFLASLQEELDQLARELVAPELQGALGQLAQRLGIEDGPLLAAIWRASKRHGETVTVFIRELNDQFEREAAAAGPAAAFAPQH